MSDVNPSPDAPDYDPATMYASVTGLGGAASMDEWALIRYVGQPIGEVVHLRGEGITVGRSSDNAVHLPDPEVSRHHSRLEMVVLPDQNLVIHLWDLGSTNGTFVNGRRLGSSGPVELKNGDVIRVGSHAFKLKRLDVLERHYHEAVLAQTTVDHLTGVSNRATILSILEKHTELARRHRRPLSMVLCDLDHFKRINDRFGHPAGDRVLTAFGRLAMNRLRSSDNIGRIGGEEFLLVLPETLGTEAVTVAEDLREALAMESVEYGETGQNLKVTCSMGVAQLRETDINGGTLLARADVALYHAKGHGRNRVEFDE